MACLVLTAVDGAIDIPLLVLLCLCYKVFYSAKKEEVKIKSRSKCKIGGEGTFNIVFRVAVFKESFLKIFRQAYE